MLELQVSNVQQKTGQRVKITFFLTELSLKFCCFSEDVTTFPPGFNVYVRDAIQLHMQGDFRSSDVDEAVKMIKACLTDRKLVSSFKAKIQDSMRTS